MEKVFIFDTYEEADAFVRTGYPKQGKTLDGETSNTGITEKAFEPIYDSATKKWLVENGAWVLDASSKPILDIDLKSIRLEKDKAAAALLVSKVAVAK